MNTKNQFKALVADLRDSLPKDKVALADAVHREAGEFRRELAALKRRVQADKERNSKLLEKVDQLSAEKMKSDTEMATMRKSVKTMQRSHEEELASSFPLHFSIVDALLRFCLLYTSPSPRDQRGSRMPSSA